MKPLHHTPDYAAAYRAAFALLHLDISTTPPTVTGVGIYSSENITISMHSERTFVVAVGYGIDYESGLCSLIPQLAGPGYEWVLPLLPPYAQEHVVNYRSKA